MDAPSLSPILPAGTPDTAAGRRFDADTKSQRGEDPRELRDGVRRPPSSQNDELTVRERALARELAARDREVRAHEAAHRAAAGRHARGTSYVYQRGPGGRLYAVGGEVDIDTSPVPGDPRATLEKAETVRRAALAPLKPSAQDRRVASRAAAMAAEARAELLREEAERTRVDERV